MIIKLIKLGLIILGLYVVLSFIGQEQIMIDMYDMAMKFIKQNIDIVIKW